MIESGLSEPEFSRVKRNLIGLQNKGMISRVGSKKTGYWEIKINKDAR